MQGKTQIANMNHLSDAQMDRIFQALADPTRRAIIKRLTVAPQRVTDLAEPFDMSLNAVSKHLKTLEKAELIDRDNRGRTSICSLRTEPLQNVQEWLDQYAHFWGSNLDAFSRHMEQASHTEDIAKPDRPKEDDDHE